MKIFLDDVRTLFKAMREEGGWVVARTGEQCLEYIRTTGLANVEAISFDNDLGSGRMEGYQVLNAIERMVVESNLTKVPHMTIHSANPVAQDRMRIIIARIHEFAVPPYKFMANISTPRAEATQANIDRLWRKLQDEYPDAYNDETGKMPVPPEAQNIFDTIRELEKIVREEISKSEG